MKLNQNYPSSPLTLGNNAFVETDRAEINGDGHLPTAGELIYRNNVV